MKLTLVHPCIGRRAEDRRYLRSWQMEPLAPALVAALTPPDVDVAFWDDRLESIPFDEPTDLVALSVETYTAKRAYQIASEYRRRGVPVVMGGFHATLVPEEVGRWADAVVVGESEQLWPEVLDDFRSEALRSVYRAQGRPPIAGLAPDRSIFEGKRYLHVSLVEAGRGCTLACEFCAVQSYFDSTRNPRPPGEVIAEVDRARGKKNFVFFVDDNITANRDAALELFRGLAPLGLRWVSQASIHVAHDEELLRAMAASGCQGLLIGFESLDDETLVAMRKGFNTMGGGLDVAMANLRRHGIRLYGTFVFGYDRDTAQSFDDAVEFAVRHRMYIAAFNHLTPFPGTPLYERLEREGRLTYDAWWTDPAYHYNGVPFHTASMSAEELQQRCLQARAKFYSLSSIARRQFDRVNSGNAFMGRNFPLINLMLRREVYQRDRLPLGDAGWRGEPLPVGGGAPREDLVAVG